MIARLWGEGFSCFNSSSIVTGNGMYPVCDMCRVVCSQLVVVGKGGSYSHLLIIRGFVEGNVAGILCIRESLHIPIPFRLNMLFLVFRCSLLREPQPCLHPAHPPHGEMRVIAPSQFPMDNCLGDQGWCQVLPAWHQLFLELSPKAVNCEGVWARSDECPSPNALTRPGCINAKIRSPNVRGVLSQAWPGRAKQTLVQFDSLT